MTMEINFIPYEPRLMEAVNAYAADMAHLADEAYSKENPDLAAKIWDTAKRLEGSPSHWGGVVPGVGLDCAGSVMAVLVSSGLFKLPPGVLASLASRGTRLRDMDDDSPTLNKRLAAHMLHFVLSYAVPEVMCIPVVNPQSIYPGDIFSPPYVAVVQGRQLPPHLAVFITGTMIMTTDVVTKAVRLVDFSEIHIPFADTSFSDKGQYPLVWRCINRRHYDPLAKMRELAILHEVEEISRKTK